MLTKIVSISREIWRTTNIVDTGQHQSTGLADHCQSMNFLWEGVNKFSDKREGTKIVIFQTHRTEGIYRYRGPENSRHFLETFPSPLIMPGLSDLNRLAIIITGSNYRSGTMEVQINTIN